MHGPFAVRGIDGIPRFPAPLVEFSFHVVAALCLIVLWRKRRMAGKLFATFLVTYGIFRFISEFWRVTPKAFWGMSAYQWLSICMVIAGAGTLYLRRDRSASHSSLALEST
jgi:phosphatidylglycerol:prolipoprotein diacylglycerol transferase